jgi:hypothetical protein
MNKASDSGLKENQSSNGKQVDGLTKGAADADEYNVSDLGVNVPNCKFQASNSNLKFNQYLHIDNNSTLSFKNTDGQTLFPTGQEEAGKLDMLHDTVLPHGSVSEDDSLKDVPQHDLWETTPKKFTVAPVITHIKRSKRRENVVDEDSTTRAERIKAKKNLDDTGTSANKLFLSFSNERLVSSITSLGISLGREVEKGVENIRELEQNRSLEGSKSKPTKMEKEISDDEDVSDMDSYLVSDQYAIQHLVGDIADDVFGADGSLLMDFKPTPRNKMKGSNRKHKSNKRVKQKNSRSK